MAKQTVMDGVMSKLIKKLHDAAYAYAEVRDARMEKTREEVPLKAAVLAAMKAAHEAGELKPGDDGCFVYKHGKVEVVMSPGDWDVKVKVEKDED